MISLARVLALDVIADVNDNDAYSNIALPRALRSARLDSRDAALATDLTYGSIRWQGFLDAVLDHCVTGGVARIDRDVVEVLRMGAYELLIRGAAPHVVNEWVDIAQRRVARAKGLVNAALRRVSERSEGEWKTLLRRDLTGDELIAAETSHPEWIVREFRDLLGDEFTLALAANNIAPHPVFVALPTVGHAPSESTPTVYSPFGFSTIAGDPSRVPGVSTGSVRVQDEGSQLVTLMLAYAKPIRPGERWLDLCAGPGGKTALLAAVGLPAGVTLVANELHHHRADLVRRAVSPFGNAVEVVETDGRAFPTGDADRFDRVLVDVPCTGLGALRRRPESRWRKSPADVRDLVTLQRQLLHSALDTLRVGGIAAYATCSPLTAETVDVVMAVLEERTDAELMDSASVLHDVAPAIADVERGSAIQLWPHRHATDAMFVQLIRRTR